MGLPGHLVLLGIQFRDSPGIGFKYSKLQHSARAWYIKPSRFGVSFVLKVFAVETGYLNHTLWIFVYRLGVVWTGGGVSRILWLYFIYVAMLCVLSL